MGGGASGRLTKPKCHAQCTSRRSSLIVLALPVNASLLCSAHAKVVLTFMALQESPTAARRSQSCTFVIALASIALRLRQRWPAMEATRLPRRGRLHGYRDDQGDKCPSSVPDNTHNLALQTVLFFLSSSFGHGWDLALLTSANHRRIQCAEHV